MEHPIRRTAAGISPRLRAGLTLLALLVVLALALIGPNAWSRHSPTA